MLASFGLKTTGCLRARVEREALSIALIGADGNRMWNIFSRSAETLDGRPNPLDRWSVRAISSVAKALGARALFPFGGPPWRPFGDWAREGEGARASPVAMQVSPMRGLWMSYRGALGFRGRGKIRRPAGDDPCLECPAPCLSACPVNAFSGGDYNVSECTRHLNAPAGEVCLSGCLVRMACPVGKAPPLAQRRFHMRAFLAARKTEDALSGN